MTVQEKTERVEARLTPEQKAILERAAELQGISVTALLLDSGLSRATEIIRERTVIELSARDSAFFAELLLDPPAPNEAMLKAIAKFARPGQKSDHSAAGA